MSRACLTQTDTLLPVQALKECVDEIDLGTQYHLSRYAFLCESIIHGEAIILQPKDENGTHLKCMYMVRS